MIPIFTAQDTRNPWTFNGYTLNSMSDIETMPVGTRVYAVQPSSAIDYIEDKLQWRDGIELYGVTKGSLVYVVVGEVYGSSYADLWDRVHALAHAFDPGWIQFANTDPFLPLTYTVPSVAGDQASQVFLMPLAVPMPPDATNKGLSRQFRITLLAKDPRRYLQTAVSLSNAGTFSNPSATYHSSPTVTFTMTGAGSATFTISTTATVQGSKSLVLDLSGRSSGQVITVDFANTRVLVNGTAVPSIYVSGDWFLIEPGDQTIAYSNVTAVGTRTMTAYPAMSA